MNSQMQIDTCVFENIVYNGPAVIKPDSENARTLYKFLGTLSTIDNYARTPFIRVYTRHDS